MITKLTYQQKSNAVAVVDRTKQATAEDFNEIKAAVNANSEYLREFPLNYRGTGNVYDMQWMDSFGALQKGDFFIAEGSTNAYVEDSNWLVAATDHVAQSYDPGDYSDPADFLVYRWGNGETMTPTEIRDALQSLSKSQQLVKTYVRGADGAINIRPQGDVHDTTFQTGFMQDILKGDRWKYYKTGTPPPTEGYTLNIGDWVIASRDGVTTYDFGNTANWELVNFPNNDLTAVEIAALLNSLTTINEMVIANRIKYNETLTVAGKIEAMDIEIEKKQNRITRDRYLYSNPINGKVFLIGGKTADIFSLRINRTPLEGVRAVDFNVEAAAYDYIYKTINETDTQITLSPDLGIEFKAGTIIDVQW